jgi:hypothetical protein
MLRRIANTFVAKSPEFRCYAIGGTVAAASFLIGAFFPALHALVGASWLLSAIALAAGFLLSAFPRLRSAWATTYGKVIVSGLNVAVLFVATALSRSIVASALGLPPQDFDLTVGALTLFMYLPIWSLITAAVSAVLGVCFIAAGFVFDFFPSRFKLPVDLVDRGFGAIALASVVLVVLGVAGASASQMSPLLRWTAYVLDFHPAQAYPGLPTGAHVRLHENGVISIATPGQGGVKITVRKLE